MAVHLLQGLILVLAVVAGFEVGYLARPPEPEPRVIFADRSDPAPVTPCPSPVAVLEVPEPVAEPPARPPREGRRGKTSRAAPRAIATPQTLADCARSGGPLCGMPE